MYKHYGEDRINDILLGLRVIFITHIHSDHNLGILDTIAERIKLLKSKFKGNEEEIAKHKTFLIIPYNVVPWFHSYVTNIENLLEGCEVLFIQTMRKEELEMPTATKAKDEEYEKSCKNEREEEAEEQREEERVQFETYSVNMFLCRVMQRKKYIL